MAIVILDDQELLEAFDEADKRRRRHDARADKEKYGARRSGNKLSGFQRDWQGTMGEIAVAKFFNEPWYTDEVGEWRELPDVGSNLEVRATVYRNGDLLLHKTDSATSFFILARLLPPQMVELAGWIHGSEGKRERFWQPATSNWRYPCYRIPQDSLKPIATLREGEHNGYETDYRPAHPLPHKSQRITETELLDWAEEEGF